MKVQQHLQYLAKCNILFYKKLIFWTSSTHLFLKSLIPLPLWRGKRGECIPCLSRLSLPQSSKILPSFTIKHNIDNCKFIKMRILVEFWLLVLDSLKYSSRGKVTLNRSAKAVISRNYTTSWHNPFVCVFFDFLYSSLPIHY